MRGYPDSTIPGSLIARREVLVSVVALLYVQAWRGVVSNESGDDANVTTGTIDYRMAQSSPNMPPELAVRLEETVRSWYTSFRSLDLNKDARELSEALRHPTGRPPRYGPWAYAAVRMPATYAAVSAALGEASACLPNFDPRSMLDAGSGPGTASWAAVDRWPGIERITRIDSNKYMENVATILAEGARLPALRNGRWAPDLWSQEEHGEDLIVAGYVLGEVLDQPSGFVWNLWQRTGAVLVIVEPGTPRGWRTVQAATRVLVDAGAYILAPAPADWELLEGPDDWCHFSVRVARTALMRQLKQAELAYEDEKYSYVIVSREPGLPIAARVLRHPQIRKGHIRLVLATADGIRHKVVSRSEGEAYRLAKRLVWGSAISPESAALFGL